MIQPPIHLDAMQASLLETIGVAEYAGSQGVVLATLILASTRRAALSCTR